MKLTRLFWIVIADGVLLAALVLGLSSPVMPLVDNTYAAGLLGESSCITITKTATDVDGEPLRVSDLIRYVITASSECTATVTGVVVSDTLPAGVEFVTATSVSSGTNPYSWDIGQLETSENWVCTITGRVDGSSDPVGGNVAAVDSDQTSWVSTPSVGAWDVKDWILYLPTLLKRWPPIPSAATLHSISNPDGDGWYSVMWPDAPRADTYSLEEDDNASFSSPIVVYSGGGNLWNVPNPGKTAGTYYYRLRGHNPWGGYGPYGNIQAVTVLVPDVPTLHPIDNTDGDGNYTVSWIPGARTVFYVLQEATNPSFSGGTTIYIGNTMHWVTGKASGTYYYRVRGEGPTGHSGWSITQYAVVKPPPTPTPVPCQDAQVMQNGGFESGTANWIQTNGAYPIITYSPGGARTGSWVAYFCGYNHAADSLAQVVTMPSGMSSARLQFYLGIQTSDSLSSPYDYFWLTIEDSSGVLYTSPALTNIDHSYGTWIIVRLTWYDNFSPHAGKIRLLHFKAINDASFPTLFVVDDVTWWTYCGSVPGSASLEKSTDPIWTFERVEGPPPGIAADLETEWQKQREERETPEPHR